MTVDKPRRGRPPRAEASRKALQGVDVANVDPLQTLREIISDRSAPHSARVRACALLMAHEAEAERNRQNAELFPWPKAV